jgi:hypothetical protein
MGEAKAGAVDSREQRALLRRWSLGAGGAVVGAEAEASERYRATCSGERDE